MKKTKEAKLTKKVKSPKRITSPKKVKSPKRITSPKKVKSPKRITSPKKVKSPKRITLPKKTNFPPTSMLENLPIEIFCEIWKKMGFIPVSYLIDVVHTSKKIASNVYYCTNKIWIDKKINLNFLKNFKQIDIIAITKHEDFDGYYEDNYKHVKKHVPKITKIVEYIKDIFICIQSKILTDDPEMRIDHANALESRVNKIIMKYFPSAFSCQLNICSVNTHVAYIIQNKNIPADYKHRLQKMKIELDKIPDTLKLTDYLTITIKTPLQ